MTIFFIKKDGSFEGMYDDFEDFETVSAILSITKFLIYFLKTERPQMAIKVLTLGEIYILQWRLDNKAPKLLFPKLLSIFDFKWWWDESFDYGHMSLWIILYNFMLFNNIHRMG